MAAQVQTQVPLNVLVTGGSGFVGTAVVRALVEKGHNVIATATALTAGLPAARNLRWVAWDATSTAVPCVDWRDVHVILHLAVPRQPFDFPQRAEQIYEVTMGATFRLLEAARREEVQRVLVASTADVLGSAARPACEDDVTYAPSSFYGTTKACAELLLRTYSSVVPTAILRLFHPYGPGGDRFLVNRLVRAVTEGREVRIEGNDGIALNPVWIDDLAHGIGAAVESSETGSFHFAGPETVTLRQLLELTGDLVGRLPVIRMEPGEGIQRHRAAFTRSARLLGYNPQIGIREGVRRVLATLA